MENHEKCGDEDARCLEEMMAKKNKKILSKIQIITSDGGKELVPKVEPSRLFDGKRSSSPKLHQQAYSSIFR